MKLEQLPKRKAGRKKKVSTEEIKSAPALAPINHLFVYGALMSDRPFNQVLDSAQLVGPGYVPFVKLGQHKLAPYPALVPDLNSIAKGELYRLPDDEEKKQELLERIDEIEGTRRGLYHRQVLHSIVLYTEDTALSMDVLPVYCYLTGQFATENLYDFSKLTVFETES